MNVFKTRRLHSPLEPAQSNNFPSKHKNNSNHSNRNLNIHIVNNLKINDYYLHARSILEQLHQQYQLSLLKKCMLSGYISDIVFLLRKCTVDVRCGIMVKLLKICKEVQYNPFVISVRVVPANDASNRSTVNNNTYANTNNNTRNQNNGNNIDKTVLQKISEMVIYLSNVITKQDDAFCQLIFMEKLHQSLVFIIKCLSHINNNSNNNDSNNCIEIIKNMEPIFKKFQSVKQKVSKMLTKKQYQMFMVCVSFWALNRQTKQQQSKAKGKQNEHQRISNLSKYSESSSEMQARLKKFDETRQNQQFSRQLHLLSLHKKSRNYRKSNSIVIGNNNKRVSTTWGRQQSVNINLGKEVIRKNQGSVGLSKFTTRKSVSNLGKEDLQLNNITIQRDIQGLQSQVNQNFRPFYFFVVVRDKMRLVWIKKAQIIQQTNKMKVYLQGYFSQSLVFHKIHAYFLQNIQSQKLRRFLLAHLKLKQKRMWHVLNAGLKLQSNQNQKKNVIQQLIQTEQQQQYKFYGFIKKYNTFFFTKYHSSQNNSKQGVLTIYNNNLQQKLQKIKVVNWSIKNHVSFMHQENDNDEEDWNKEEIFGKNYKNNYEYDCEKCIVLSDCNLKMKSEKIQKKKTGQNIFTSKKKQQFMKVTKNSTKHVQKQKSTDIMFVTTKKERKYIVISQQIKNSQKIYSNLKSQTNFRNMFSMRVSYSSQCQYPQQNKLSFSNKIQYKQNNSNMRDDFLCRLYRKSAKQMHCVVNRRMGKPIYVKIQSEISFVKKVNDIGYIQCKMLFFHPDQGDLIIVEAYLPQTQKYYVFMIPSSIILSKFVSSSSSLNCTSALISKLLTINNSSQMTQQKDILNVKPKHNNTKPRINYHYIKSHINFHKISNNFTNQQKSLYSQFNLAMVLPDCPYIQGKELLYRKCQSNSEHKPEYIDIVTLQRGNSSSSSCAPNSSSHLLFAASHSQSQSQSHTNLLNNNKNSNPQAAITSSISSSHYKTDEHFTLKRYIYKMTNNLRNLIKQQYKIDDWSINKKYGRYCQFIQAIKQKFKQIFIQPKKLFNKNMENHYFCRRIHGNMLIDKIVVKQKNQWQFVHFNQSNKQLEVKMLKINNKTCCNQVKYLRQRKLKKYLSRFLGDSVLRNTLLKQNFMQMQIRNKKQVINNNK